MVLFILVVVLDCIKKFTRWKENKAETHSLNHNVNAAWTSLKENWLNITNGLSYVMSLYCTSIALSRWVLFYSIFLFIVIIVFAFVDEINSPERSIQLRLIFILFYFILFYFISFHFILFYFILFYFILFYFILFYFILFYFILFYLHFRDEDYILLNDFFLWSIDVNQFWVLKSGKTLLRLSRRYNV